ncbi:MAG: PaaI family thioesterase [Treponema sp.]|uniref:PaaI family thioesterase n=1 Tax=Treponema sp. TaxID=166 RepID=UPI00298E64E9|nr:PaaI family thioesterase [Treponema sp.]MBR5933430.1 PaaI family thioesterase [Treponema sp.]
MTELEQAREFFINDRYAMVTTGIQIEDVGTHYAKCSLKIDERHLNANNHVMGGVFFTLADFTFAVSSNRGSEKTVTTNSTITYLGRLKGDTLISESRLIKSGAKMCTYEISIKDNLDNPIALIVTSGMYV